MRMWFSVTYHVGEFRQQFCSLFIPFSFVSCARVFIVIITIESQCFQVKKRWAQCIKAVGLSAS